MPEEEELPPIGVVMDGGFGAGIDEFIALTALHATSRAAEPEVSLAAVNVTNPSLTSAQFVDALGNVYSEHHGRLLPKRFRRGWSRLPVGLLDTGSAAMPPTHLAAALERKNTDGDPLYPTKIKEFNDTGISAALIRNALTAHHEGNCLVLLTGAATALAQTLGLNQGRELASAKVKTLVVGGDLSADASAARKLLEQWPTPIVAIAPSASEAVRYPLETLADGFDWATDHPLVDAYKAAEGALDARIPATLAAFYSVRPEADYWNLSEPGRLRLSDDGTLSLEEAADGPHRLIAIAAGQHEALLAEMTALVQSEPAARPIPGFLKKILEREKAKEQEEQEQQAAPNTP